MTTNQTTCTSITRTSNTSIVVVTHNPVLPGAMAVPVGLFNLILTTFAITLLCCHTGWARKFTEQCLCRCLLVTIMILLAYLAYSLSCLTLMLVQNCHEIIPALTLAVALFNLPLGTVAITFGPYLLYCLLVRRNSMVHHYPCKFESQM